MVGMETPRTWPVIEWTVEQRWSIYTPLAGVIADAVAAHRDQELHGFPARLVGEGWDDARCVREWADILDRIEVGFRAIALEEDPEFPGEWADAGYVTDEGKVETLRLFGEFFLHLWD